MKSPEQLAKEAIDRSIQQACRQTIDRLAIERSVQEHARLRGLEVLDWSLDGKLLKIRCMPKVAVDVGFAREYTADE